MKKIVLLGSTGSIGTSSLDVIARLGSDYQVMALTANENTDLLLKQAHRFKPRFVAVLSKISYELLKGQMPKGTQLLPPEMESLTFLASLPSADLVINGLVGSVGFMPLIAAIKAGKTIALANKEPIVMAGQTIMEECHRWNATIIPVDSEPSAIFQCLENKTAKNYDKVTQNISRVFLTASGGPFANRKGTLSTVTPEEALNHPRWSMGKKITIDSATLMNKGFESIEIMNLFNLPAKKLQIVIHPQSIIHSAAEYVDGSVLAQMSTPDMRIPIQYAITYPERAHSPVKKLNLFELGRLDFSEPDFKRFPCLQLAFAAVDRGGLFPAVLSGADEVAVDAFLKKQIKFTEIAKLIYSVLKDTPDRSGKINLNEAIEADQWAKEQTKISLLEKKYKKVVL